MTCRSPGCDNDALGEDAPKNVRGAFCSAECEVRYDHLKQDARDAQRRIANEDERVD
jgi:hypothetical protein